MADLYRIDFEDAIATRAVTTPSAGEPSGMYPRKTEQAALFLLDEELHESIRQQVVGEMTEHGIGYSEVQRLELELMERDPADYDVVIPYYINPVSGNCSPGKWQSFSFELPAPVESNTLLDVKFHSFVIEED